MSIGRSAKGTNEASPQASDHSVPGSQNQQRAAPRRAAAADVFIEGLATSVFTDPLTDADWNTIALAPTLNAVTAQIPVEAAFPANAPTDPLEFRERVFTSVLGK